MALHWHLHSSNRCQSYLQRHPPWIQDLHHSFMAHWPLPLYSSSLRDTKFSSSHTRVRQVQISPELKALPQKQQHRHLAQARTPRLLHPTSTCPSTFQHLCNIPHLSTQIPSPRLVHHCWPIWWHASNTLWMASLFLFPHPKSSSGQSAPIYLQEQLQT